jgi:hypothetical protein
VSEDDIVYLFQERIAIMCIDGHCDEDKAIRQAFHDLRQFLGRHLKMPKTVIDAYKAASERCMKLNENR